MKHFIKWLPVWLGVAIAFLLTVGYATSAEARGWAWFVSHIKSGPHCAGRPTTYYGEGRHNADGSSFSARGYSAASWDYPFGTVLRVVNCANGQSVEVVVKDRGPGRSQVALGIRLDLSTGAARAIALGQNGRFESGYTAWSVLSMGSDRTVLQKRTSHRHGGRGVAQPVSSDYMSRAGAGM